MISISNAAVLRKCFFMASPTSRLNGCGFLESPGAAPARYFPPALATAAPGAPQAALGFIEAVVLGLEIRRQMWGVAGWRVIFQSRLRF